MTNEQRMTLEERIEYGYWEFDARQKGLRRFPKQSERDAYKHSVRAIFADAMKVIRDEATKAEESFPILKQLRQHPCTCPEGDTPSFTCLIHGARLPGERL